MKPTKKIIDKAIWDEREDKAEYTVGYYDRVEEEVLEISVQEFKESPIPHHRIKYIKQDGNKIFKR